MDTTTAPTRTSHPWVTYVQVALTLLATTMLGLRTLRTANGQALAEPNAPAQAWGAVAAGTTTAATVVAAVLLLAQRRRPAAAALVAAVVLELTVLERLAAPPRLVTALPLLLALALFALLGRRPAGAAPMGGAAASWRSAAGVVGLVLMVPVGLLYLLSGLAVPAPAVYAMYLLYALLLVATALLARRRSVSALVIPPAAVGLWMLLVTLGGEYLGWQA